VPHDQHNRASGGLPSPQWAHAGMSGVYGGVVETG